MANFFYKQTVFIEHDGQFTRFQELANYAQSLKQLCEDGEVLYVGFTNMIGDIWSLFYYHDLRLDIEKQSILPVHYIMLQQILQIEQYNRWQRLTVNDDLLSVLTTISVAEQLKKWLLESAEAREMKLKREQFTRATANYAKLQQNAVQAKRITEKQQLALQQQFVQKQQAVAAKEYTQAKQQLQQSMQHFAGQLLGNMFEQTTQEIIETKQAIVQIGTLDGKKLHHIAMREQLQLAQQIKQHALLKRLAHMIGQFQRIAQKKQKQQQRITMERKHVKLGQEVERLLPMELANLVIANTKLDFLRRFVEQQTLVFDTKGKDRKGRGPIIICIDESSSMTQMKVESKAFCLALLMIANKQKRDFAIIPFASDVGPITLFPKGRSSIEHVMTFSQQFLGGGTNYEKPLRASLQILSKSEFNKADVLFVTDGSSFLSSQFLNDFNAMKKQRQFECTSIVLTNGMHPVDLTIVRRFSDRVIEVDELFEAEDAFSI